VIFLDANVFLRHLTPPGTKEDVTRKAIARYLFERLASGELIATTSEVVIHEVCYVLSSPRQYGRSAAEIVPALLALLQLPGFRLTQADREVYVRAFELWNELPKLEFSDSVIAARCERAGHNLATFDGHFAAISSRSLWNPEPNATTGS